MKLTYLDTKKAKKLLSISNNTSGTEFPKWFLRGDRVTYTIHTESPLFTELE